MSDQLKPGDVFPVEGFTVTITPKMLAALGITPDMSEEEVRDRWKRAWWQAAHHVDDERRALAASELTALNQDMRLI